MSRLQAIAKLADKLAYEKAKQAILNSKLSPMRKRELLSKLSVERDYIYYTKLVARAS